MYLHHTEHCRNCIISRSQRFFPLEVLLAKPKANILSFSLVNPRHQRFEDSFQSVNYSFSTVEKKNVTGLFQKPVASNEFWIGSMER